MCTPAILLLELMLDGNRQTDFTHAQIHGHYGIPVMRPDPVVFSGEERQQQGGGDPGSGQLQPQARPHVGPRDLPGHAHQRNTLPQL